MLQAVSALFRSRARVWLDRRIPRARSLTLDQNRIFIFPSPAGFGFVGLLAILLLVAINYQNNMVFTLVFLLASAFVVTILHTFANLSGLSITVLASHPAFVGDPVRFDVKLARDRAVPNYDITLSWAESEKVSVSLIRQSEAIIYLRLPARRRGLLQPPRLLVESFYPLGLLRCWTLVALDMEALVYPRPTETEWTARSNAGAAEGEAHLLQGSGSDDFYAFKGYQPGDALKHVSWKHFARGQGLMTKQFVPFQSQQIWLDWDDFSGDTEARLSALCYWTLVLAQSGSEYGVRLPQSVVEPDSGEAHRDRALAELALFGAG